MNISHEQKPSVSEPGSDARQRLIGLAVFAVALLVGCLFVEGGLRLLKIQPRQGPYDPNVVDADLGMRPLPSLAQKADFDEYAGTLILQTNNRGFYQMKDTPLRPSPGVTRTVALGDSFTAGACNANENFPSIIEQRENRADPDHPVEMLNAGVGRYSPYQSYVQLQHDILPLQPAHIIVAEYVGNDFLDMIRQDDRPYLTERPDGTFDAHRPRFVSYEDPSIPPGMLDHSRLFAVLKGVAGPTIRYQYSRVRIMSDNLSGFGYGKVAIAKYLLEVRNLDAIAHGMMLQILHQQVWFDRFPETLKLSLDTNRHVIEMFRDLCRARGIRLTYTVIPSADQIEPEKMADTFSKLTKHDPKWTVQRVAAFDERLVNETERACKELGVEYIDVRDQLRSRRGGQRFYYPKDLHMNAEGNRALGETLAAALLAARH